MCVSCEILQPINTVAESYARQLFGALAPDSSLLFQAFLGLWFVGIIFKLLKGKITLEEVLVPLMIFSVVTLALKSHHLFWDYIYKPIHNTTIHLLTHIVASGQQGGGVKDLNGLLGLVETSIGQIITFCGRVSGNAGWTDIAPYIAGFFLLIPYMFLWAIFMVFTVEYVFKLLIVSALAPLFIVAAAFKSSRGYAISALKVVLQAVLTICISVIAMGVTLQAINSATAAMHLVDGNSAVVNEFSLFSIRFCSLFALGITAVFFQLKAPGVASSISGSQDGAGLSGAIAGSVTGFMGRASRSGRDKFVAGVDKVSANQEKQRINDKLKK